jgi:hypothetical protein
MSDRYEREIDELMNRLEGRMRREPLSRKVSRRFAPYSRGLNGAFAAFLRRPPTEQFMIAAMVLVVLSFVLNMFGLGLWAFYASVLSIVLFVLGIALSLAGRHSPGYQKRWRGREIDYGSYGPSIWTQFRNWLRRRRH